MANPRESKKVTLDDLAESAGVSKSLVSSFLTGKHYGNQKKFAVGFSRETQGRIMASARKLGFVGSDPGQRVRLRPEQGDLSFLLNQNIPGGIANPYFSMFVSGILHHLDLKSRVFNVSAFLDACDYQAISGTNQLPRVVQSGLSTQFVLAGDPNPSLLNCLRMRGHGAVYLSRRVDFPGVVSLVPDFKQAGILATQKLLSLGHRRIAAAAHSYFKPKASHTGEIISGVGEAMAGAGLSFEPADVVYFEPTGMAAFARGLGKPKSPTAVFCFDDYTALTLMRAVLAAGFSIPGDLSVIGANGEHRGETVHPALTTVSYPCWEMGKRAVALLHEMSTRGAPEEPRLEVFPVSLTERESLAPPKPLY